MQANGDDIRIARVVGESEDGLTLFVPKDMSGEFHLEGGEAFLSLLFIKSDGQGGAEAWVPWADGPVLQS